MSAEIVIKTLLEADAAVVALVASRLYSCSRPEVDPLPAVVWIEISDAPRPPVAGLTGSEPCDARIQVNCLASSSAGAKALKDSVVTACHKQSGTIGGVVVTAILQDGSGPRSYDALVDTWQQSADFLVHYVR